MKQNMNRRSFLKGSAVAAGASAMSFTSLFGISRAFAQDTDDDLQTIINLAATAELFASTHYLAAINAAEAGDLDLDQTVIDYLKTGFLAEQDHYDLLVSLGAVPGELPRLRFVVSAQATTVVMRLWLNTFSCTTTYGWGMPASSSRTQYTSP